MEYKLKETDGLYFAQISGKDYLIDTGSPETYSLDGEIVLEGKTYRNQKFERVLSESLRALNERYGMNACGILGNDALLESGFTLDKKRQIFCLYPDKTDGLKPFSVKKTEYNGLSFVYLDNLILPGITEEKKKYYIDTGTNISHMSRALCHNVSYAERKVKYYPALKKEIMADLYIFPFMEEKVPFDIEASLTVDSYLVKQMKDLDAAGFISLCSLISEKMVLDMKNSKIYLDNNEKKK